MNLFHTNKRDIGLGPLFHIVMRLCAFCLILIATISVVSCTDDKLVDNPSNPEDFGDLMEVDLPGVIGINLTSTGVMKTRDGETPSFSDGDEAEYLLAPTDKNHFILIYKSEANEGSENDTPLVVISMSFNEDDIVKDSDEHDNITITANSALTSKSLTPIFTRIDTFSEDILDGNIAYVLLNFDCSIIDKANTTAYISDKNSNVYNLARLTRKQLLNLPVNDYKINVDGTDYFTMANAVYGGNPANANDVIFDYEIIPNNVFSTETASQNAKTSPAIKAYVERLAVKYSVSINLSSGSGLTGDSGLGEPSTHEGTEEEVILGTQTLSGIYTYNPDLDEKGYDISMDGGYKIKYNENGSATIKVIGYGVSNLEERSYLLKKISNINYFQETDLFDSWNDDGHQRSYWSEDFNYTLAPERNILSNARGYPQQFRLALETDTITSLFNYVNGYEYADPENYFEDVTVRVNGVNRTTRYYKELGKIKVDNLNSDCVLKYRSFNELMADFDSKPFYSLENTYYDPGMKTGYSATAGQWAWEWKRAPYTTSTNFLLLCKIEIDDFKGTDQGTVYRGQNNIFYSHLYDTNGHNGLIDSKLEILNEVMLNGGNAGFQIFDGKWDSHQRGTQETVLDKIAWNENSYVWMSTSTFDAEGKELNRQYKIMEPEDFTLIPAELAGGDGQCLIAPKGKIKTEEGIEEGIMGKKYHYYLAPRNAVTSSESGEEAGAAETLYEIDDKLKVEISFNHLVGLIHKIIGPIDVFTNGYMYYALPISHNEGKFIESWESYEDEGKRKENESWRTLGKVGVVRNNWYQISVNGLNSVGTPIHDLSQPIVPVMDIRRSYMNMGVRLLNWHTISQGNVPM